MPLIHPNIITIQRVKMKKQNLQKPSNQACPQQVIKPPLSLNNSLNAHENINQTNEAELHVKSLQIISGKLNLIMKKIKLRRFEQIQKLIRGVIQHAKEQHNLAEYVNLRYPNILNYILKYYKFQQQETRKIVRAQLERILAAFKLSALSCSDLQQMDQRVSRKFQQIYIQHQPKLPAQLIQQDQQQISENIDSELEIEQQFEDDQESSANINLYRIQQIFSKNTKKGGEVEQLDQQIDQISSNIEIPPHMEGKQMQFNRGKDKLFSKQQLLDIINEEKQQQDIEQIPPRKIEQIIYQQHAIGGQLKNDRLSFRKQVKPNSELQLQKVNIQPLINNPQIKDRKITESDLLKQQRKKLAKQIINLQEKVRNQPKRVINLEQNRTPLPTVSLKHLFGKKIKNSQTVIIDGQPLRQTRRGNYYQDFSRRIRNSRQQSLRQRQIQQQQYPQYQREMTKIRERIQSDRQNHKVQQKQSNILLQHEQVNWRLSLQSVSINQLNDQEQLSQKQSVLEQSEQSQVIICNKKQQFEVQKKQQQKQKIPQNQPNKHQIIELIESFVDSNSMNVSPQIEQS